MSDTTRTDAPDTAPTDEAHTDATDLPRTDPTASFFMVVPPGWARLPAREDDRQELAAIVRDVIARALPDDLPRDRAEPLRQEMRKRLTATVVEAGDNGANAVYLAVQPVDGYTPPVSIIETEVEDESDQAPEQVIAQVLADALPTRHDEDDPGIREVDGGIAARTETVIRRVDPGAELPGLGEDLPVVDDRQVVYTIPVPHRPGRWVVMSFSAISAAKAASTDDAAADTRTDTDTDSGADDTTDHLTDALVTLFDAIMTTFRWTDVPGTEPTTLERRLAELGGAA
ncbi:hypothetical protein [Curtobacterium sp. VKM Ac-1395]|uniref:hypothetical protein n=1 Tax=Curtobacterium sp. VKM Ac-1395 TaxID=2783815 RepID=UPI00188BB584|nr:hypothetical protein [Curtobacterium sp. VKM Ac-1395]MBF4588732.1 hypothetical protein [Curtobacterium sp. VKM Ac-1395]